MATLRTADFDYPLPQRLIARRPVARRDRSRLLVVPRDGGALRDRRFEELPEMLAPGDGLVLNDTRVFPARLLGRKPTGARVEVLLLRPLGNGPAGSGPAPADPSPDGGNAWRWQALVRPGGKLKPGRRVLVGEDLEVEVQDSTPDGGRIVRLRGKGNPWELIERYGRVPLPPYIGRASDARDGERYQTVYARRRGSVAAPTAGLHFTRALLRRLRETGVRLVRVTLHVGLGTFRPVETERLRDHRLDPEPYFLGTEAARALNRVRDDGGRVWAVGTTVCRLLETVVGSDGRFRPARGWTDLFIYPPYRFRAVDGLITNFHLPRSSLLMLVSAFAGRERVAEAYRHAVARGYRFYSYGDAMLLA